MTRLNRTLIPTIVVAAGLIGSVAQATAAPPPAIPIPPSVAIGVIIANELVKPKPFCRVFKAFNKKKRC